MNSASLNSKKSFAIKVAVFTLPVLVGLFGLFFSALVIGEVIPPAYVLSLPNDTPGIYRPIWDREQLMTYKLAGALQRRPDVLLLSSSRGLYVRSAMFARQPETFFNASFSAAAPEEHLNMVEILAQENAMPAILLLPMDYPHFNIDRVDFDRQPIQITAATARNLNWTQVIDGFKTTGRYWVQEPLLALAHSQHNLHTDWVYWGVSTWENDRGYLMDGSQYRVALATPENIVRSLENHEQMLQERNDIYEVGSAPDEEIIQVIARILTLAQENGTQVIGYLPPYRTAFYDEIMTSSDYAYIAPTTIRLQEVFDSYGYSLVDLRDVRTLGGSDEELFDSWHPGERLAARIVLALYEANPDILGAYVDPAQLEQDIAQADDPFFYYVPLH